MTAQGRRIRRAYGKVWRNSAAQRWAAGHNNKKILTTIAGICMNIFRLGLLFSLIWLTGCASMGIGSRSMDELTQQYTNQQSRFVNIDGLNIHYRDEGQGAGAGIAARCGFFIAHLGWLGKAAAAALPHYPAGFTRPWLNRAGCNTQALRHRLHGGHAGYLFNPAEY